MPNSQDFENRTFHLGIMDTDSSPEYVKNGTYRYALNVTPYNTSNGSIGTITNISGNTEIEYDFNLGENPFLRVIGSKLDLKRNRVYWFVYGQTNNGVEKAFVLYYDYITQDVVTVFNDPNTDFQKQNVLEFSKDGLLKSVEIIYDDLIGDTLLWTDTTTEPKKLNVKASIARFNSYTTKTTGFVIGDIKYANINNNFYSNQIFIPCICVADTNTIPSYNFTLGELNSTEFWEIIPIGEVYSPYLVPTMFYQKPIAPYFSPNAKYNYDEEGDEGVSGVATFLRRRSFQFRYKYVYFDGQESEWSPISEAVFSSEPTSAISTNNGSVTVDIDFPTPKSISVRLPIVALRASSFTVDTTTFAPHSMISRVKVAIRNVPNSIAPEDWYQFADIQYSDFYKYNISPLSINTDFPVDSAGTYFYNWDTNSFKQVSGQLTRVTTITIEYDGSQTLIPIDVLDTSTLYYNVPNSCVSQSMIDNRVIYGAGKYGMSVSNEVIKSVEDNLSIDLIPYDTNFNVDNQDTPINFYNPTPSLSVIVGDEDVFIGFGLNSALDEADFNTTFFYDFTLNIILTYRLTPISPLQTIDLSQQISGQTTGIPSDYSSFKDFIESEVEQAYENYSPISVLVSVDEITGSLTLRFSFDDIPFRWVSISQAIIINAIPNASFYTFQTYLPERSFKNHSKQQYAVAFFDPTGRITNVISPDNLGFDVDHFVTDDLNVVKYKAQLSGLSNILVPEEAVGLQLLRKRSESYSNYIQFCISRDNCPQQSWNSDNVWVVGFINLELDETTPSAIDDNQKNLYITLNSVNGGDGGAYESLFDTQVLDFTPQEGDVLRFLYRMNDDGDIIEKYSASFSISNYSELWNTVVIDFSAIEDAEPGLAEWLETTPTSGNPVGVRVAVEIIKKGTQSEQEFYYEVAAQYSCSNGSVDVNSSNDSISLYGDTYLKVRGYCIDYNSSLTSRYQNFPVQDKNYNDFAPSANQGTGRQNAKLQTIPRGDNYFSEVNRDNLLTYSEQSIQNTDVRKYGTVYDANIQEVDNIYGRIEFLYAEGDTLDIYQEDKRSRMYAGRSISTELNGAERVIASQNQVFSDVIYQKGNYGISRDATSFATNGYQKYYTDSKRGNVYRESLDGITAISEIGMSGYFKNLFKNIRNSYTPPIIRGIADNRTDEYVLSVTYSKVFSVELIEGTSAMSLVFLPPEEGSYFPQFQNGDIVLISLGSESAKYVPKEYSVVGNQESYDGQITVSIKPDVNNPTVGDFIRIEYPVTETMVYSERTKGWTSFLSFNSEWMSEGIQSYLSFVGGSMWLHDLGNETYNTFHGRTFDSTIQVISNQQPQLTKYYLNCGVKGDASSVEIKEGDIETSEGQVSHIPNAYFIDGRREGTYWSPFLCEGSGTQVLNGERLRGRYLSATITLNQPDVNEKLIRLFSVVFHQKPSGFTM